MQLSHSKISHTILEFGKALINELPEPHSRQDLENTMQLIITVWNAVVLDQWHGTNSNCQAVQDTLNDMPREAQLHVKRLIKRKHKHFGDDLRGVGRHWIKEKNGEFIFGCDARAQPEKTVLH